MERNLTKREKSTLLTIIFSFIPHVLIMVLGAIKTKYIIYYLGSENNGIYQLMLHLSSFVVFGNLGLGTIFKISYYKSISANDKRKTTAVYNYSKYFFKKATIIMTILSILISIIAIYFVDAQMSTIQIVLLQFLICSSNILNFYIGKDATLLSARQKEYIYAFLYNTIFIIRLIVSLLIISLKQSLFLFLSVDMIIASLGYLLIEVIIKIDNKKDLDESKDIDKTPIYLSKYLIPNKVSGIVFLNIDTILISKMISNISVSIYTSYIYVANCLINLESYIIDSLVNSLGNLYHSKDTYKESVTKEVILLSTFVYIITCIPFAIGMNSFVTKIWIGNESYTLDMITYILICLYYLFYCVRRISGLFEDSIGSYKETFTINILQAVGNVILSIILCRIIGLNGIILATIIILAPFEILKIRKSLKMVNINISNSYIYKFLFMSLIEIVVSIYFMRYFTINGVVEWLIYMFFITVGSFIINGIIYLLLFKEFRMILHDIKKKVFLDDK